MRKLTLSVLLAGVIMGSGCASSSGIGPSIPSEAASDDGKRVPTALVACPSSPNCVNSASIDAGKAVEPFELAGTERTVFQDNLIAVIEADGGVVNDVRSGYVWATYTSSVFRFVDDVEWLFNAEKNAYDVRSASRVGYSDFGVNAKRVKRLRNAINAGQ